LTGVNARVPPDAYLLFMNAADQASEWWNGPLSRVPTELGADGKGLTDAEARARFKRFGPNELRDRPQRSLLIEFLRRFRNPLVLILIAASAVSALTGEIAGFLIIAVMVMLSVTVDFIQEHRAGKAADRLRQSVQVRASVLRGRIAKDVPMTQVVPGDIALLAAGSLVPADGRLLDARNLFVNQAALTGESLPVEKRADAIKGRQAGVDDATTALFMGSSVVSGTGRLLVCRTGSSTAMVVAYLVIVEAAKRVFYRRFSGKPK